jgi:hypothetical protein
MSAIKKRLVIALVAMLVGVAHAGVVSSKTKEGAPAIDLGVVSGAQCTAVIESPVMQFGAMERGFIANGRVMTGEEISGLCAARVPVHLILFVPMVTVTERGVKSYPIHRKTCVEMVKQAEAGKVLVGGKPVQPDAAERACTLSAVVEVLK